jgi:predicted dehydrogenase
MAMISEPLSRRHFFVGSLLAGAIPVGGFGSTPSLGRLGYKSPNEKLNIAAIAAGGRAASNIAGCASENIVAFADPDDARAAPAYQKYEKAARYRDFRRMLDKEGQNIDAVIISTPDHVHAVAALMCMERGKHVYLEKPMARTIWETRLLAEAAARYKVATQMGNQGASNEGQRIACEIIWSGEIGNVTEVHAWTNRPIWPQGIMTLPSEEKVPETLDWDLWLGPASMRPYNSAYLPFNWRGWFDFGCGAIGDIACHELCVANSALLLGAPISVEVVKIEGRSPYTFPKSSQIHIQFPARGSMPPVKIVWYDGATAPMYRPAGIPESEPLFGGAGSFGVGYPGASADSYSAGTPAASGGSASPKISARYVGATFPSGAIFVGDKGYLTANSYAASVRLLPESRHKDYKLPPQLLTRSPGHYRDWIRACKGGDPACSNFALAGPFTEWALLGTVAVRFEGKLEWDGAKMRFANNAEANKFIKPIFRNEWQIGLKS